MLADSPARSPGSGALGPGIHRPGTFLQQVIEFVAEHLPGWRDDPDRPQLRSERELTSQLSAYLNAVARNGLDVVQFQIETPDDTQHGRSIDLTALPLAQPLYVAGRRYTKFQVLLPIECKRLPTPDDPRRDPREYVTTGELARGGIQRFKLGFHGATHAVAVIIAYIQAENAEVWVRRINEWIAELARVDASWAGETLTVDATTGAVHRARSLHSRGASGRAAIELQHLWIEID
jgi:hypothetical protein